MKNNIEIFNQKYKTKGGFKKLQEFKDKNDRFKVIANHFGVDRRTVSDWMKLFFDEKYDPRHQRKEKLLKEINENLDKIKDKKLLSFLCSVNVYYFKEAIKLRIKK